MNKCERCNQGVEHVYCCHNCEKFAGEIAVLSVEKRDLQTAYNESKDALLKVESERDAAQLELSEARKTAQYWKAEHLAGNKEIENLQILLNQTKAWIVEIRDWKDTPWCKEVDLAIEGKSLRRSVSGKKCDGCDTMPSVEGGLCDDCYLAKFGKERG